MFDPGLGEIFRAHAFELASARNGSDQRRPKVGQTTPNDSNFKGAGSPSKVAPSEASDDAHGLFIFLLIGAVAGSLAGLIMRSGGFGLLGDIVVGVIGAEIGGWLGISVSRLIGSIIAATVGAIILIAILQLIERNWMSIDKR